MITPAHYPYSTTYLSEKMRAVSFGILELAVYCTSAAIALAIIVSVWRGVAGMFQ